MLTYGTLYPIVQEAGILLKLPLQATPRKIGADPELPTEDQPLGALFWDQPDNKLKYTSKNGNTGYERTSEYHYICIIME